MKRARKRMGWSRRMSRRDGGRRAIFRRNMLMARTRKFTFWIVKSAAAAAAAFSVAAAVAAEVEERGVLKLSARRGREAR